MRVICADVFSVAVAVLLMLLSPVLRAQTHSRTHTYEYYHDLDLWVVGAFKSETIDGIPLEVATYGSLGEVLSVFAYGKLVQSITYDLSTLTQKGTVATATDGRGNTTVFSSWKRGIPQVIRYPATPEAPGGAVVSAGVNNSGWITHVTNEVEGKTCYGHDAMGRVNLITFSSEASDSPGVCSSSKWEPTTIEFRQIGAGEWRPPGIDIGQWRHYTSTANYQKLVYLDSLWRPVLTHEYDAANTSGTLRSVSTIYDAAGRVAFQSYPSIDLIPAALGTWTFYDALGRAVEVRADSEHGQLVTKTEYLGRQIRVTRPDNGQVLTTYQAFDVPAYEAPTAIAEPLGRTTLIRRDQLGKPVEIERKF